MQKSSQASAQKASGSESKQIFKSILKKLERWNIRFSENTQTIGLLLGDHPACYPLKSDNRAHFYISTFDNSTCPVKCKTLLRPPFPSSFNISLVLDGKKKKTSGRKWDHQLPSLFQDYSTTKEHGLGYVPAS